jgi:hypothetical protein
MVARQAVDPAAPGGSCSAVHTIPFVDRQTLWLVALPPTATSEVVPDGET